MDLGQVEAADVIRLAGLGVHRTGLTPAHYGAAVGDADRTTKQADAAVSS